MLFEDFEQSVGGLAMMWMVGSHLPTGSPSRERRFKDRRHRFEKCGCRTRLYDPYLNETKLLAVVQGHNQALPVRSGY
jgi:hypothetical protein